MPRWLRTLVVLLLLLRLWPPAVVLAAAGRGEDRPGFAAAAAPQQPGPVLHDDAGDDDSEDDGGDDDGGDSGGNHGDDGSDEDLPGGGSGDDEHDDGHETYDRTYSFYGQVRWSGERTIVGSRELVGDDPWIAYLAPGMRLEVKGEVQDSRIRVSAVEIKYPTSWTYYLGPARVIGQKGGWVRAWLAGTTGRDLFRLLPAPVDARTPMLVACYARGSWRAVPLGLRPELHPPEAGWWRLTGTLTGSGVNWSLADRLPGECN